MKTESGIGIVECKPIDRDEITLDPSGWWFLIRVNFRYGIIEAAACHSEIQNTPFSEANHAKEIFTGRSAQDIYHHILENTNYVTSFTHAAYLGKELKKAEVALALGIKGHYQE